MDPRLEEMRSSPSHNTSHIHLVSLCSLSTVMLQCTRPPSVRRRLSIRAPIMKSERSLSPPSPPFFLCCQPLSLPTFLSFPSFFHFNTPFLELVDKVTVKVNSEDSGSKLYGECVAFDCFGSIINVKTPKHEILSIQSICKTRGGLCSPFRSVRCCLTSAPLCCSRARCPKPATHNYLPKLK